MHSPDPPPLRLLLIIHTAWSRNLGASRVLVELTDELRAMGHTVTKFSVEDAFPASNRPRRYVHQYLRPLTAHYRTHVVFPRRARAFVAANGNRFDVVDALHTDLPYSKRQLRFRGVLVARSVGLLPAYREFDRWAAKHWPDEISARDLLFRLLTLPSFYRRVKDIARSFHNADVVNVSNRDDLVTVGDLLGDHGKVVALPFGLSDERLASFARAAAAPARRLEAQTVVFIGAWNPRKGSRDWPAIAANVLQERPGTRFLFLGTGQSRDYVLRLLPAALRPSIEVIPAFDSDQLPELLSNCTVGAFPGYLEGFGFAVLEKLAAGLPTVTYDAPGPREMMCHKAFQTVVSRGDIKEFSLTLVKLLTLSIDEYALHSEDSGRVAKMFSWREIAARTVDRYRHALTTVNQRLDEHSR